MENILSIMATISVFSANIIIRKYTKVAIALFIVCNVCYVLLMSGVNKTLMYQNIILAFIGLWNLFSYKNGEVDGK